MRRLTGTWVGRHDYRFCSFGNVGVRRSGLLPPYFASWPPTTAANWPPCSSAERSARIARAGLETLAAPDPGRWPWPTFVANILGAFLLGYFTTRLLERLPVSSYRRPLLGTGLCGGLTTFSTMQVETIRMLEHQHYGLAVGYTATSIGAGLFAVYVATRAGAAGSGSSMTIAVWAGVLLLGGTGAVLRFLVDRTVAGRIARSFPFGTLAVNLSGAMLLGFLSALALSPHVALLAGTAFVGSYTTFSTWMLETQRLGEERQVWPAVANIVVSVTLGLAAAWVGQCIGFRV